MKYNSDLFIELADHLYDGVYMVDKSRKIRFWSKAAESISGYPAEEVMGKSCFDNVLRHVDDSGIQLCLAGCPLGKTLEDGINRDLKKIYLHRKDGSRIPVAIRIFPLHDAQGRVNGAIEIFNIDSSAREVERQIRELSQKAALDSLTGMPKRDIAEEFLSEALHGTQAYNKSAGLLFIDIDNFKKVNDSYGHNAGDVVLKVISETLVSNIRPGDMFARWGGEEFVACFQDITAEQLQAIAQKFIFLVNKSSIPISDEKSINMSISVGATLASGSDSVEEFVGRADTLMYQAKKEGRNRFVYAVSAAPSI